MIKLDVPEADYHADRTTLSSTGAKRLLRSPRQFRYELDHPRQITAGPLGTLTHALVFRTPHDQFKVKDWDARTREGKLAAQVAEAEGQVIIDQSDWDMAHDMATSVLAHPVAGKLFTQGRAEVSVYADDPNTGVGMRGRIDWWRDDDTMVDLKTAQDASPGGFARAVASLHYHVQDSWYDRLGTLNGRPAKDFIFVAVEKTPPYLIGVYRMDARAMRAADVLVDRACEVYRDCKEAEESFGVEAWPEWGRPSDAIETLSLPRWAFNEVEDSAWL